MLNLFALWRGLLAMRSVFRAVFPSARSAFSSPRMPAGALMDSGASRYLPRRVVSLIASTGVVSVLALTTARTVRRECSGSVGHAASTVAKSGSIAPDSAPPFAETCVFPGFS
jgi:hypothetical protein